MSPLVAILVVSIVFYLVVPGIGAFGVRQRWRRFRAAVISASRLPRITYSLLHRAPESHGLAQFLGALESIQGDNTVWLQSDGITVAVDMTGSSVFVLEGAEPEPEELPPLRTTWSRLGSLPAGTRVLVAGLLDTSGPHPIIRSSPEQPLLALFYDGPDHTLVRRSVWSGRQRNEYWNSVTPGSLVAGSLALILIAYLLVRQPPLVGYARLAIVLASTPVLPLLPPGVALFYLYRLAWRRGRRMRAHRDVVRLPLRYLPEDGPANIQFESGEYYCETELPSDRLPTLVANGVTVIMPPSQVRPEHPDPYFVYGRPAPEGIAAPAEPLAEWIALPDDPRTIAPRCESWARRYELASAALFTAAIAANFVLLILVVARVV